MISHILQTISYCLRLYVTFFALKAHEHVETFHVILEHKDLFLYHDFPECRKPLVRCAAILAWIRNKLHIILELGQSGL